MRAPGGLTFHRYFQALASGQFLHGLPATSAELVPHRARRKNARGIMKDRLLVIGDIIAPIDVEWDALR